MRIIASVAAHVGSAHVCNQGLSRLVLRIRSLLEMTQFGHSDVCWSSSSRILSRAMATVHAHWSRGTATFSGTGLIIALTT
jgi:hypothetical protein